MRADLLDTRILGAVRFIDATTGTPIQSRLEVAGDGARFIRKRLGAYVLASHPAFDGYGRAFGAPPSSPVPASVRVELTVADPGGHYLPRRFALRLPRDPDPARANRPESLFAAEQVRVFPAPAAPTSPGWAVVRATVLAAGSGHRLPGALVQVLDDDAQQVLATGQADWRGRVVGEALVPVVGIPVTMSSGGDNGAVVTREIATRIEAIFDPAFQPQNGELPDPEGLAVRRSELPSVRVRAQLASGRSLALTLSVPLPPEE